MSNSREWMCSNVAAHRFHVVGKSPGARVECPTCGAPAICLPKATKPKARPTRNASPFYQDPEPRLRFKPTEIGKDMQILACSCTAKRFALYRSGGQILIACADCAEQYDLSDLNGA